MDVTVTRVLTASERPEVHTTIARALALLGEGGSKLELVRADTAADTLAVATAQQPRIVFLDVTIGGGAGVGLVHFLQSMVPGLVVVAIVPEGADHDVRLVEQAASLGASWVLLGELTGDDVLRAFGRVAPALARSVPPVPMAAPATSAGFDDDEVAPATRRAAPLDEARTFRDLDATLATLAVSMQPTDLRAGLLHELRAAIERCVSSEREGRATIQDATSSAYSFAYFVDLAGREIDLARRHGRRFALASVDLGSDVDVRAAIEIVLGAVRDTDVVARADEGELLLLLPETGAKGARTLRRRVLDRLQQAAHQKNAGATRGGSPVRIGIASFPFDGEDLSRLLRIARRRAERWATWDTPSASNKLLSDAMHWLGAGHRPGEAASFAGPLVPIDVPLRDGWALFDSVVREATRGGDAIIALHAPQDATEASLGLAQGVRAAALDVIGQTASMGPMSGRALTGDARSTDRDVLSLMTGVSRLGEVAAFPGLEVVAVLGEHACYGLVGRVDDGRLLALQGHDLPVVEALVNGLEQPVFRRGSLPGPHPSSSAPSSGRASRSDPAALRR